MCVCVCLCLCVLVCVCVCLRVFVCVCVRSLYQGKGFCFRDEEGAERHYPYLCARMEDGKAMAAGNPRRGCRCWVCSRSTSDFNTAFELEDEDTGARFGAIASVVPTRQRIGANSHCAARSVTAVVKRLQAAASAHSQTAGWAFRAFMRDLKQEALKVPVANRVRKTATKDHTIDITTSLLLLRDGQLQQQLLDCILDWGLRRYFGERYGEGALEMLDGGLVRKRVRRRDRPARAKRVRAQ